jgi:K+-transporting ATPase ATPase A chain
MLMSMTPLLVTAVALIASWPLGSYLRWAMDAAPALARAQAHKSGGARLAARLLGPVVLADQDWRRYVRSMLTFNGVMFAAMFVMLSTQGIHPLNPDGKAAMEPSLAFNTAASFTSNTNLQHYAGEVSLSYFSQIFGVMWLQFLSAATGLAAVTALCRGLSGRSNIGNFYRDIARATGLILLPLSLTAAMILTLTGVPMTLDGAAVATTLEGLTQTIARGPVAAVVAIKQLGTNGGGFFGTNSTHPYENPGFWGNAFCNGLILLLPMATVWMFGRITGRMKHAAVIFGVMLALFAGSVGAATALESAPTAAFDGIPVASSSNLEGKELRFGPNAGAIWAVSTTMTSNGSVNAMHDSLNPLTGLIPMVGMWLNVVFGGVGVGMINMFIFVVVAVFIAGLMVGRTPEYLTRKIEAREIKLATIALLSHPLFILGGTAVFACAQWGADTLNNPGSHGLSEIIYEFSSAAANNGSGFEGLRDNTIAWNIATGVIMLLARFIPIIAPLAIVGSLAAKRATPESAGTFQVDTWMFGVILAGVVLIVGALLFLPLAVLGPVSEHLAGLN